ncbi:MAG: NADH-quinone oxidoreductase subunit H [Firmicutes bacterium]|nr:NADH-quinone oxidoreductase subunit H [Bacillota bacterium]
MSYPAGLGIILATFLLAPVVGGLLTGLERKVIARLQGRVGPPLTQPFYDLVKLWHKRPQAANRIQIVYVYAHLFFMVTSLLAFLLGQDLLLILFIFSFATVALILGGLSVDSPYSRIGSQREIIQLVTYEPILVLLVIAYYQVTGSFMVSQARSLEQPLLFTLPLVLISFLPVFIIKVRKSPFDLATQLHEPHQELVKGIITEYSGPYLALIELASWYELVFLLALVSLFWATNWVGGLLLAAIFFFAVTVIDNITPRVTYSWMVKFVWKVGLGLAVVNVAWLYLWK